jgi:hypothetical protein
MSDNTSNPNGLELVVQELQDRIGKITSSYETQMAVLKAQATIELAEAHKKIEELSADKPQSTKKS